LCSLDTRTEANWQIKLILSSYSFINGAYGPPDGLSDCAKCLSDECKRKCTKSVPEVPAHDPNVNKKFFFTILVIPYLFIFLFFYFFFFLHRLVDILASRKTGNG